MPAQSRKSVPSRVTPGAIRARNAASRSRLQSPSRKRNEADARKASDRSRLQAPKSAASTPLSRARSRATRPSSAIQRERKQGLIRRPDRPADPMPAQKVRSERLADPLNRLRPSAPRRRAAPRRPINRVPRTTESRSRLRRS